MASGEGLRSAVAGRAASFVVTCRDAFGNVVADASDAVLLPALRHASTSAAAAAASAADGGVSAGGGRDLFGGVRPPLVRVGELRPNGLFGLSYTPKLAGELALDLTLNGEALPGSPFAVTVVAGEPSAVRCMLRGEGLEGCAVPSTGVRRSLTLSVYDVYGNKCLDGNAIVVVELRALNSDGKASGAPLIVGGASHLGDGKYSLEYTVAEAGEYELTVALGGEAVAGVSPTPSPVHPTPCALVFVKDAAEEAARRAAEERRRRALLTAAEEARRREAERAAEEEAARRRGGGGGSAARGGGGGARGGAGGGDRGEGAREGGEGGARGR